MSNVAQLLNILLYSSQKHFVNVWSKALFILKVYIHMYSVYFSGLSYNTKMYDPVKVPGRKKARTIHYEHLGLSQIRMKVKLMLTIMIKTYVYIYSAPILSLTLE